jgi:NADPH-dependent curcumin reductase CurA
MQEGVLHHREDVRSGFENLPETFGDLFVGRNDGTLLVVTDDAARGVPGR